MSRKNIVGTRKVSSLDYKLLIRNATLEDAANLAPRMREADKREVAALANMSPLDALTIAFHDSNEKRLFTVELPDHQVGAIAGASTKPSGGNTRVGVPWLLGSDELFALHWREFFRRSKEGFRRLNLSYDLFENYAWIGNTTHLKWLKRVGAEFGTPEPHGLNMQLFVPFTIDVRNLY